MIVLEVGEKNACVDWISFSPDGKSIRFILPKKGTAFYTETRNLVTGLQAQFPSWGKPLGFCEHPDSEWVFANKDYGLLGGYSETQQKLVTTETLEEYCTHFAITPNGSAILFFWISANDQMESGYASQLWLGEQFSSGFSISEKRFNSASVSSKTCYGIASIFDSERFATLNWRWGHYPILSIRSVSTGEITNETRIKTMAQPSLAASPSENLIAVMVSKSVYLFDPNDLSLPPRILKNDGKKHFTGVAFHPSGRLLGVTSNDTTVKFYDTETWAVTSTFNWDIGKLRSIAFSNDGTLAAAGSDTGKVVIWDVDL